MAFRSLHSEPQWRPLYAILEQMQIGDVITYEQMSKPYEGMDLMMVRGIFFQARKHMLKDKQRAFENVRGVGYRMVHPREQGRLATGHERKARRQANRALTLVTEVEHSMLTREERKRIEDLENHYRNMQRFLKQLKNKHDRLEQRVSVTEKDHSSLVDRVDQHDEVLQRLEALEAALRRNGISAE